jgi:hypothetical protein
MRIAVSGTHCCGKSTLIDAFLIAHPDFAHEPEPYIVLQEDYGEIFASEPSADDFYRQLEFQVDRLHCYKPGDLVIYERSPVDFFAYLLALNDLHKDSQTMQLIESSYDIVRDAIQLLDVIVFLPLNDNDDGTVISDSEDPALRIAVNDRLTSIFNNDDFNLFISNRPLIVEAIGSTPQRLQILESFL